MLLFTIALCILSAVDARNHKLRIVNGDDAREGQYPYIVSIRNAKGRHSCGGSIISPQWILTAAHCINDRHPADFSIQYGVIKVAKAGPNVVEVKKLIQHPGFRPPMGNDIGLMELAEPLQYNELVQPIPLADDVSQSKHGDPCTLVGWGRMAENKRAKHLQELHYQIIGSEQCAQIHKKKPIYESQICAAYPGYTKSQCSGDSGGPLTANGVQVGIVSWSNKPCDNPKAPGVFTLVAYYRDWILEHAGV